jgi:hypothetical protein
VANLVKVGTQVLKSNTKDGFHGYVKENNIRTSWKPWCGIF